MGTVYRRTILHTRFNRISRRQRSERIVILHFHFLSLKEVFLSAMCDLLYTKTNNCVFTNYVTDIYKQTQTTSYLRNGRCLEASRRHADPLTIMYFVRKSSEMEWHSSTVFNLTNSIKYSYDVHYSTHYGRMSHATWSQTLRSNPYDDVGPWGNETDLFQWWNTNNCLTHIVVPGCCIALLFKRGW